MNSSLDDLRTNLYRAAQEHHRTGALYYAALERSHKETQKIAADEYRLSAEMYLKALSLYGQHLISIERDEELDLELQRVQTRNQAVKVVLNYL